MKTSVRYRNAVSSGVDAPARPGTCDDAAHTDHADHAGSTMLNVEAHGTLALRFDDGSPVRAASAIAPFGSGWLIAQDDATHAAWWRDDEVTPLRLFPPVDGHDLFCDETGTKRLKPDLEAACAVDVAGTPGVLLLGSGSLPNRTRAALVREDTAAPCVNTADLAVLYDLVGRALGVPEARLNLEGACVVDERLRWFQRGDRRRGVANASVDVDLATLLAAILGDTDPTTVPIGGVRRYNLDVLDDRSGDNGGVPLGITDAVALADGRVLVCAAAEDTDDPVEDGPVSAAALAVLSGSEVAAWTLLPADAAGRIPKVEGLAILTESPDRVELLAVVDADDPSVASPALHLTLSGLA